METHALSATQFQITVSEQGYAVAVTELLLNSSFDDVMASASRLLGRNMATYLDVSARTTLLAASSVLYGYNKLGAINGAAYPPSAALQSPISPYDKGTAAANRAGLTGAYTMTAALGKDVVETLNCGGPGE